jgi:hypothetical protein
MGEELGWKMSPSLSGFHYGYLATGNILWVDRLIAFTDERARAKFGKNSRFPKVREPRI